MFFQTAFAQAGKAGEEETSSVWEFLQNFGIWVFAIFLFLFAFFIANLVKKIVVGRIVSKAKNEIPQEAQILMGRAIYIGVLIIVWAIALNIVGVNVEWMLGALSVGLGFAFKDLLANLIGGMVLLTQKKFHIGDMVQVNDRVGRIVEIESRTTQIEDFDGTIHIVPNADMLTSVVRNYTSNSFRRISLPVGVHYNTPLDLAMETCLESVKKNTNIVVKPSPNILLTEFGESAILLEIRFWVESAGGQQSWLKTKTEIINQLKKDFDAVGITIPFPIRTIALDSYDQNLKTALHLPKA